ncbi:MAG: MotA/TolQ/ExbB proton channel family protein [Kiritimatiellae bacterium]|nr:MotA/TolQ/ExbB proton channel family protein [Kiritimatiellia bacterium]
MISQCMLSLPLAGIGYALQESNMSGKIIVVVLVMSSIWAWSIILTKTRELQLGAQVTHAFVMDYRKEASPVALFLKHRRYQDSPAYRIYDHGCNAMGRALEARGIDPNDLFSGTIGTSEHSLRRPDIKSVRNVAERTYADECLLLENRMGLLATAATSAPFLGLLGTVWGVMESFGGMASQGSAMLSAVAPGISGALLTTVVGLLVALPSAIAFNLLSDKIRRLNVEMSNFLEEFVSDVERHYEEDGV